MINVDALFFLYFHRSKFLLPKLRYIDLMNFGYISFKTLWTSL